MQINLTMEFDSINEMREFLDKRVPAEYMPQIIPVVMEAGALEGARQDDGSTTGSAMLPQPKINTRKPRTAKQTEPAAPATEAPTQAPLVVADSTPAPVAAAPVSAPAEPSSETGPIPVPVETPPAVDNAAAQAAIEAVFAAKGFQGAHQLLAQFGVARLRELDAAKYGELVEYANKMLAK